MKPFSTTTQRITKTLLCYNINTTTNCYYRSRTALYTCYNHHYHRRHRQSSSFISNMTTTTPLQRSTLTTTIINASSSSYQYTTLLEKENFAQTEVKKSKFLAWAWPITSIDHANQLIQQHKDTSASHNCYAMKCGPTNYKSSDDGEPGGTAGRPILAAIDAENLDYVAVLVVRYYGGVKLGTGGLARAYGGAAREVLQGAPRCAVVPRVQVVVNVPFDVLGVAYQVVESSGALRIKEDYYNNSDESGVELVIEVESDKKESLIDGLRNASHGKIAVRNHV